MADKKTVDITGPTDAKVDIGSKPMIVGHKPMASDPMMRDKASVDALIDNSKPAVPTEEIKNSENPLPPPSSQQKTLEPIIAEDESTVKTEVSEEVKVKEKPVDSNTESKKPEDEAVKDETAKKEEIDPLAVEMEKEEQLRKLIDSKKYFVNIKQSSSGSFKKWFFALIGTIAVLIVALFVLIDTNTLDLGIKLPFRIFGEEKVVLEAEPKNETAQMSEAVLSELVIDKSNFRFLLPDGVWSYEMKNKEVDFTSYSLSNKDFPDETAGYFILIKAVTDNSKDKCQETSTCSEKFAFFETTPIKLRDGKKLYLAKFVSKTGSKFSAFMSLTEQESLSGSRSISDYRRIPLEGDYELRTSVQLTDPATVIYGTLEEAIDAFESPFAKSVEKVILSFDQVD